MESNAKVEAELVAMNGTVVSKLMEEEVVSGSFSRSFQTHDLAAGIYLVRVHAGNNTLIDKVVKL